MGYLPLTRKKISLPKEFQIADQAKIQEQGPENQAQSKRWTALGTPPEGNHKTQTTEEKARAKQPVFKSTDYIASLPYESLMIV